MGMASLEQALTLKSAMASQAWIGSVSGRMFWHEISDRRHAQRKDLPVITSEFHPTVDAFLVSPLRGCMHALGM